MRRNLLTALVFVLLAIAIYFLVEVPFSKKHIVTIRGASLEVEVANNSYLRKAGLMGRQYLDMDQGMLFMEPGGTRESFWMKNMLFPLDVLWMDEEMNIFQINKNVPPCTQKNCPSIPSQQPAKYVLEIKGGICDQLGIAEGDAVNLNF